LGSLGARHTLRRVEAPSAAFVGRYARRVFVPPYEGQLSREKQPAHLAENGVASPSSRSSPDKDSGPLIASTRGASGRAIRPVVHADATAYCKSPANHWRVTGRPDLADRMTSNANFVGVARHLTAFG
jgi:hypothetical protein